MLMILMAMTLMADDFDGAESNMMGILELIAPLNALSLGSVRGLRTRCRNWGRRCLRGKGRRFEKNTPFLIAYLQNRVVRQHLRRG